MPVHTSFPPTRRIKCFVSKTQALLKFHPQNVELRRASVTSIIIDPRKLWPAFRCHKKIRQTHSIFTFNPFLLISFDGRPFAGFCFQLALKKKKTKTDFSFSRVSEYFYKNMNLRAMTPGTIALLPEIRS